jgi:hypothetical protein
MTAPSDIETPATPHRPTIKEGSVRSWLQVIGAFCIFFNVWYGDSRDYI